MATAFSFQLEGVAELRRRLKGMRLDARKKAVRAAAEEGAAPILAAIKARVPVDTGTLRDSIGASIRVRDNRATARITPSARKLERRGRGKTRKDGTKDKRARYAVYQEFGTKRHAPHPFMMPGFDAGVKTASDKTHRVFRDMVLEHTR